MGTISKALNKYSKERKALAAELAAKANSKAESKIPATGEINKSPGRVTRETKLPPVSRKVRALSTQQLRSTTDKLEYIDEKESRNAARPAAKTAGGLRPLDPARTQKRAKPDRSPDVGGTGQTAGDVETRPPVPDPGLIDGDLISLRDPHSTETKLFKYLRNKILHPIKGKPPRTIMVTSAMSGEGKSFIAANLAINMAQNIDEHVLLMDCDLRVPCLHHKFGFTEVVGLSEYLTNEIALSPLLMLKTSVNKLTLLPAGSTPDNPAEILSSEKMKDLIDELKTRYDDRYIIIDAPPPLVVPDVNAIANKVDGIILVASYRKTNYDLLDELVEEIGTEKIIGAVINRSKARSSRRYGYKRLEKYTKYNR